VLSTGDPMVSGLGTKFKADTVEPGVSSVLVALSRIGKDLCDVVVVKCHAKECLNEILKFLTFRPVLALVTRSFDFRELSKKLKEENVRSDNTILYLELLNPNSNRNLELAFREKLNNLD